MPSKKVKNDLKKSTKKTKVTKIKKIKNITVTDNYNNMLILETGWEVCTQLGGIYTVLRSKAKEAVSLWSSRYCLLGPFSGSKLPVEFNEITDPDSPFFNTVKKLNESGIKAHYGEWLIMGRPQVVLLDLNNLNVSINEIKYFYWDHHQIPSPNENIIDQVLIFASLAKIFIKTLIDISKTQIIAHFHEWMGAAVIPEIKYDRLPVTTVFTTHATYLGRIIAMNNSEFYEHLPVLNWEEEAKKYNIETQVKIERAAAWSADVFTTVSNVTAVECKYLLGKDPDYILPNGINFERFVALHEFQNLHRIYKEEIHEFVIGHFFQNYSFDLDKTLYFLISGRYEYNNKGYNLALETLNMLNNKLKAEKSDITIVVFLITKKPFFSINPEVLHSRAVLHEINETAAAIGEQIGKRLFITAASGQYDNIPELDTLVDEYWMMRLKRTIHSWKNDSLPKVLTHKLVNDKDDEILNFLRYSNLVNKADDRVKIVYHPDFISPVSPLLSMEYEQFVRGCHLGIFPSYYEPWGYTPMECIALGVPSITSDLSGFGSFIMEQELNNNENGIYVVNRKNNNYHSAAEQLLQILHSFTNQTRRDRISQRNRVESNAEIFDWKNLISNYKKVYEMAADRYPVYK